jgi:UDP-N-acetylmuramate dehydrogenase
MIQENYSLKELNTFGIDATARYYFKVNTLEELAFIVESEIWKSSNKFILGGGSNIVFTNDFDGLVVNIDIKGIAIISNDSNSVTLQVGAGEIWHNFVAFTVDNNYFGLENLALIPGKVGAAPVQNIGAYGVEQKDFCLRVHGLNLRSMMMDYLDAPLCDFSYRESIFKNSLKDKFIITSVEYQLSKTPSYKIEYGEIKEELANSNLELNQKNLFNAICSIRQRKLPDPAKIGNCGSFFKNPIITKFQADELISKFPDAKVFSIGNENLMKVSAGWLIEKAGWKGKSYLDTDAAVSPNHALVLINKGKAKGLDLLALSNSIIEDIQNQFGIVLEREVNIL